MGYRPWGRKESDTTERLRFASLRFWKDPLEEGRATHSSILAWKIPWAEEPGGLQSMEPQSQMQLNDETHARAHTHTQIYTQAKL